LVAHASLVTNAGFETESVSGTPPALLPTGWTIVGTGIASDRLFPNTGTYDMSFGAETTAANPGVLSQAITTTPGATYFLTFAVFDVALFSGDSFKVGFGGFTATITGDQTGPLYTAENFLVPGSDITGTASQLSFKGLSDPSQDIDWNLDDVSLTRVNAIPEPSPFGLLAGATGVLLAMSMIRPRRGA
jgi:hypothetical protein